MTKVLDSEQIEGMVRRVLNERARKGTLRYLDCFVLIATLLLLVCYYIASDKRNTAR